MRCCTGLQFFYLFFVPTRHKICDGSPTLRDIFHVWVCKDRRVVLLIIRFLNCKNVGCRGGAVEDVGRLGERRLPFAACVVNLIKSAKSCCDVRDRFADNVAVKAAVGKLALQVRLVACASSDGTALAPHTCKSCTTFTHTCRRKRFLTHVPHVFPGRGRLPQQVSGFGVNPVNMYTVLAM